MDRREYHKQWKAQNPEKVKEHQKRWKACHPERVAEYQRQWRARNPEHLRQWCARNPDKLKEYRERNKEKKLLYNMNRKVRAKGFTADLTQEQWEIIKNVFKQKCVYCGKRTRRLTKDHVIPLSKGGALTLTNIVPACLSCNSKKRTGPPPSPLQTLFL